MKRFLALFLAVILSGCDAPNPGMERFLALRQELQSTELCSFRCAVTSDYGQYYYSFMLDCTYDGQTMTFSVVSPETISGITGQFHGDSGGLAFDGKILALESLADGQIPPVSAPWILLRALTGGYVEAEANEDGGVMVYLRETYADDAVEVNVLLDGSGLPSKAEMLWQGRRILTLDVENFQLG